MSSAVLTSFWVSCLERADEFSLIFFTNAQICDCSCAVTLTNFNFHFWKLTLTLLFVAPPPPAVLGLFHSHMIRDTHIWNRSLKCVCAFSFLKPEQQCCRSFPLQSFSLSVIHVFIAEEVELCAHFKLSFKLLQPSAGHRQEPHQS